MSIHDTICFNAKFNELKPDPTFFHRIPDDKLVDAYFNWFNRSVDLYYSVRRERASDLIFELNRRIEGLVGHRGLSLPLHRIGVDKHGHHRLF